jgi:hypothetical protein
MRFPIRCLTLTSPALTLHSGHEALLIRNPSGNGSSNYGPGILTFVMQNFVRDKSGGAASPQGGRPPNRSQLAAQARVNQGDFRNHQTQQTTSKRVPDRGEHRISIPQPQQQSYGQQAYAHDLYDTDARSIDTTIDRSTVMHENEQMNENEHDEAVNAERSEYEEGDEDDDDDDGDDDDDRRQDPNLLDLSPEQYEIFMAVAENQPPPVQKQVLQAMQSGQPPQAVLSGQHHQAGRGGQHIQDMQDEHHLQAIQSGQHRQAIQGRQHPQAMQDGESVQSFGGMEGDSYPTTTSGEPSEWKGKEESVSEVHDYGTTVVPQHRQPETQPTVPRPLPQQSIPRGSSPNDYIPRRPTPDKNIFKAGAKLREQKWATNGTTQLANRNNSGVVPSHRHQNPIPANGLPERGFQQPLQAPQPRASNPQAFNVPQPLNPVTSAPTHTNVVGNDQNAPSELAEQEGATSYCDYNYEDLTKMSYTELKNESFDTDPNAEPSVLPDNIASQPLGDRLEFARQNLDNARRSNFFSSLPATEWEEAGDWFLDQFSSLIEQSRKARQKKRKLAHAFEDEVEQRHQHVAKRQQQVEDAMAKMKAQGEGLMPKSPRPSKLSKPRRG